MMMQCETEEWLAPFAEILEVSAISTLCRSPCRAAVCHLTRLSPHVCGDYQELPPPLQVTGGGQGWAQARAARRAAKRLGNFTRLVELHWSEGLQQFLDFGDHTEDVSLEVPPRLTFSRFPLLTTACETHMPAKSLSSPPFSPFLLLCQPAIHACPCVSQHSVDIDSFP